MAPRGALVSAAYIPATAKHGKAHAGGRAQGRRATQRVMARGAPLSERLLAQVRRDTQHARSTGRGRDSGGGNRGGRVAEGSRQVVFERSGKTGQDSLQKKAIVTNTAMKAKFVQPPSSVSL